MTYSIIVLLIVLLLAAALKESITESFAEQGTVFSSMAINHKEWLPATYTLKNVHEWNKFVAIVKENKVRRLAAGPVYVIADPYDASNIFSNKKVVGVSKTGYFVALMDRERAFRTECSYNIFNKKVGYFDISDRYFIKALAYGHRIPWSNVTLERIDYNTDLEDVLRKDIDVIITYVIPGSPFFQWLQVQQVSVMGFANIDIDRIRLSYPYVEDSKKQLKEIFYTTTGTNIMVLARENDSLVPGMRMQLLDISTPDTETFIDSLEMSRDALDPDYRCYGDDNIDTKALCNSKFDVMGLPKRKPTIWDRPCKTNEDCPFYKANKKYPNERGKCLSDGTCELPIGVKRKGFTLFSDRPFCYNCTDPIDPNCCDTTGDYAFKDDYTERKKYGLETSIVNL